MSVNNFENNVQQKLDELRLRPTEQVWVEVERRIREKKRRRIIFWFLLPGLVLLGGGAWWMMNQPAGKKVAVAEKAATNNNEKQDRNNTATIEKNEDAKIERKKENNITNDLQKESTEATAPEKIETVKSNEPTKKIKPVIVSVYRGPGKPIVKKQGSASEILKQLPVVNEKNIDSIFATIVSRKPKAVEEIKNEKNSAVVNSDVSTKEIKSLPEKKTDVINIVADTLIAVKSIEKSSTEIKSIESIAIATDGLVKPATAETTSEKDKKKKSKWEFGVTTNIGATRLYNKGLINLGMKSADLLFSSPSTGAGGGQFNNRVYADSIPLKGFAWQAGVFAKRKTGKKISYSVGLNISYYSTNQVVGIFVDSIRSINNDLRSQTSAGFYRYGGFNSYKNKYYYIQAPLLLQWQINKGKKLPPFILENGLSPSFMFASKALVYDKQANLFFTDKRLYNKFSVLYHTAFDVKLFSGKNHPLTAGFFYDFHISRLQKVSPPDYNYLQSFGLKINYTITPALSNYAKAMLDKKHRLRLRQAYGDRRSTGKK